MTGSDMPGYHRDAAQQRKGAQLALYRRRRTLKEAVSKDDKGGDSPCERCNAAILGEGGHLRAVI